MHTMVRKLKAKKPHANLGRVDDRINMPHKKKGWKVTNLIY